MSRFEVLCAECPAVLTDATLLESLRHRWIHEADAERDPIEHAIDAMVEPIELSKQDPRVFTVVL